VRVRVAPRARVGDHGAVYRAATPTLYRLSLARRRRVRFEIAVCALLALLAATVSLEVARTSPAPAPVLTAGAAIAALCVWLLWRSLRALSLRLTLHPGGALAVASWHGQTTEHAEQVRDVQSPDDGGRDDVELLDAEGRRLAVIPAVFEDAGAIAAWRNVSMSLRQFSFEFSEHLPVARGAYPPSPRAPWARRTAARPASLRSSPSAG